MTFRKNITTALIIFSLILTSFFSLFSSLEVNGETQLSTIKNATQTFYLSVENSSLEKGARVLGSKIADSRSQEWEYDSTSKEIKNSRSKLCLDVSGANFTNGTKIYQWECNGFDAQKWYLQPSGALAVRDNENSKKFCIDSHEIEAGYHLQIWECHLGDNQLFTYEIQPELKEKTIKNSSSDFYISVEDESTEKGSRVIGAESIYSRSQEWDYDNETKEIKNSESNLCLDVSGGNFNNRTKIYQWECNGLDAQKWYIQPNGAIYVKSDSKKFCLDSNKNEPGYHLHIWECHFKDNQKFTIDSESFSLDEKIVSFSLDNSQSINTAYLYDSSQVNSYSYIDIDDDQKFNFISTSNNCGYLTRFGTNSALSASTNNNNAKLLTSNLDIGEEKQEFCLSPSDSNDQFYLVLRSNPSLAVTIPNQSQNVAILLNELDQGSSEQLFNIIITDIEDTGNNSEGELKLGLPFPSGQSYYYTGGPHDFDGACAISGFNPDSFGCQEDYINGGWGALDFSTGNSIGEVTAMDFGVIKKISSCELSITHRNGYETRYYHLTHITKDSGFVAKGEKIGEYRYFNCGVGTGKHIHASLWKDGVEQNIFEYKVGSYYPQKGESKYTGCLIHENGKEYCPGSLLLNDE